MPDEQNGAAGPLRHTTKTPVPSRRGFLLRLYTAGLNKK
jgi:hypothetical protein